MDSVPVVFITGQVRTELLGTDGFQEADTIGITRAVTIEEAFEAAATFATQPLPAGPRTAILASSASVAPA